MSSVTFPPQFPQTLGTNYGYDNVVPPFYLNGAQITANLAAFPSLPIALYNTLEIRLWIAGLSGSDTVLIQFNGDTGNNYWSRNVSMTAASALNTNVEVPSTSGINLGIALTKGMFVRLFVGNFATQPKTVSGVGSIGTGAAGTIGVPLQIAGEWENTTAQISSVLVKLAGANTILTGSSIQIFGGV